jgi:hypothetical protein
MPTYIIRYDIYCNRNLFGKETRVKNCQSELHAKVKLNEYCKKHPGFTHIIIHSCREDNASTDFLDFFNNIVNPKK